MKKPIYSHLFSLIAIAGLLALSACGGSSSGGSGNNGGGGGTGGSTANSRLNGTYTFYVNGLDSSAVPYSMAGAMTLDGSGNITGGEQDLFDGGSSSVDSDDSITSGTYTVNSDGHGTATLNTTNDGTEVLAFMVVNDNHLLITEFDNTATSSGAMDMQTATTVVPAGGFSFTLFDQNDSFTLGGVLTSDGSASFTNGLGDQAVVDQTSGNLDISNNVPLTGSFGVPDSFGRGTITLNDTGISSSLQFAYYAVGPEVYRLVEIDGTTAFAAGSMYSQGTGGALSAQTLNGNFAFNNFGVDGTTIGIIASSGEFTTDGSALVTAGFADVNDGSGTAVTASAISGAYGIGANGRGSINLSTTSTELTNFGVYTVDPALNIEDPNNTSTGLGGALLVELDTAAIGTGVAVPQASTATLSGSYGIGVQAPGVNSGNFDETDFVGTLKASSGKVTGTVNLNDIGVGTTSNLAYTGTIGADSTHAGRLVLSTNTSAGVLVDAGGYESSAGQVFLTSSNSNLVATGIIQPAAAK
jgi:hypothetical protein